MTDQQYIHISMNYIFLLLFYHLKHNSDKRKRKKNTVCTKNVSKGLKYIGVPQKLTHVKCDRESAIHKPSQNGGKK